jgi:hypothetical protein
MGVWDNIEAAGFPIKIGASYTWARTTEPWEFEFLPLSQVTEHQRPESTTDWSFLSSRAAGENWFLCGESLGFADPILAAG